MAIFKDTTITDNGRALIADTLANNKQIIFTRMITSSKIYEDSTDVSKLTNIDEIKQTVSMSKISQEGTRVRLNAVFTNSTVNTSYKIQTIGLYAKTGTGNEILYSITRAKEPDVMPATNGINLATVEIDLITEINNSNGATMLMNPSTLVTTSNLVAELEKIAGLEFGGNIQDIGNKTKGKFYYDSVTKFYYECIEDNSLTYNDSGKFRAISNKPLSDKVENLCEKGSSYFKIGDLIIQGGIANYRKTDGADGTVGNFTIPFKNSCFSVVSSDVWNGTNRTSIAAISRTQFRCWGKDGADAFNDTTIRWLAVGY
nr:MAG TPA: tail collar fiber protein [Caudoviricetes sp.]